jgi:hypothetical protein
MSEWAQHISIISTKHHSQACGCQYPTSYRKPIPSPSIPAPQATRKPTYNASLRCPVACPPPTPVSQAHTAAQNSTIPQIPRTKRTNDYQLTHVVHANLGQVCGECLVEVLVLRWKRGQTLDDSLRETHGEGARDLEVAWEGKCGRDQEMWCGLAGCWRPRIAECEGKWV